MKKLNRILVLLALIGFVGGGLALAPEPADAQMREFTGRIDKLKKKKFIVDNRMGDKVSFSKIDDTEVTGEKDSWKKLKKGDWVTVSWKFIDKPRKAYKIVVLPDEPYAFGPEHARELRVAGVEARFVHVDGKDLSWYGPRIPRALAWGLCT